MKHSSLYACGAAGPVLKLGTEETKGSSQGRRRSQLHDCLQRYMHLSLSVSRSFLPLSSHGNFGNPTSLTIDNDDTVPSARCSVCHQSPTGCASFLAADMSQQAAAQLLSRVLGGIARYSVATGIGVAALQASLYTGQRSLDRSERCTRLCRLPPQAGLDKNVPMS